MYRIINYVKFFSFILTAILLSACSSTGTIRLYDGAQKNEYEIVTFNLPEAVDLLEVDGKKVTSEYVCVRETISTTGFTRKTFAKDALFRLLG